MRGMSGANWPATGLKPAYPSSAPPRHLLPQGEKGRLYTPGSAVSLRLSSDWRAARAAAFF